MATQLGDGSTSCDFLNFYRDDEDASALTVLRNHTRFHIIADPASLQDGSENSKKILQKYRSLLTNLKIADGEISSDLAQGCDNNRARHPKKDPPSLDSNDSSSSSQDQENDSDSGVDVSPPKSSSSTTPEVIANAETSLQNWMVSPFGKVFEQSSQSPKAQSRPTLQQWYECKTVFYTLRVVDGKLSAVEEDETESLRKRIDDLIPCLQLPKYILNLNIPWIKASDMVVTRESGSPLPFHPSGVQVGGKNYFVKVVDVSNPGPTKREIRLMKRIEKLGLHKQFKVPLVEGLVGFENSKNKIMGFLQTDIEEPTPLTNMLASEVSQKKRDHWAEEVDRIKNILHDNNIIWGDAKADNFMVDKHDELWIIDFGGSYTEGWIDAELNETEEGDEMGIERIKNGLHDPEANTCDPDEDITKDKSSASGRKRRKSTSGDDEDRKRSRVKKS